MLTNFEVLLYASSLIVLPIAIYSLLTGSKAPEGTWIAKYYAAETYLGWLATCSCSRFAPMDSSSSDCISGSSIRH